MALERNRIRQRFWLARCIVLACLLVMVVVLSVRGGSFAEELALLERQPLKKVGRDALVSGYEQLLADYPDAPRRAEVMLRIANLWELSDPKMDMKPNHEKGVYWLREARAASPRGSTEWFEASFRTVGATYQQEPGECRRMLQELIDESPDFRAEAKAYYYLQMIASFHRDVEEAEKICMKLQSLDLESDRMPKETLQKGDVFSWIQDSEALMMATWAESTDMSEEARKAKINAFAESAQLRMHIDRDRDRALKYMEILSGPRKHTENELKPQNRRWLLWLNVVVVSFIVLALLIRQWKRRGSHA